MTHSQKIWLLRVFSIPALFYLPIIFIGIAFAIFRENRGDSFPMFALLAMVVGVILSIFLSRRTLFVPGDSPVQRPLCILLALVAFEAGAYLYFK
jgi:hypothetical protein